VRLCTVANARRQLATVLVLAVLYNAPKFAESRLVYHGDGIACAEHTSLIDYRLYLIVYGNVLYTVFMLVIPLATLTVLNVRLMAALNDVHQKRRQMQSARQQHDNNVIYSSNMMMMMMMMMNKEEDATNFHRLSVGRKG